MTDEQRYKKIKSKFRTFLRNIEQGHMSYNQAEFNKEKKKFLEILESPAVSKKALKYWNEKFEDFQKEYSKLTRQEILEKIEMKKWGDIRFEDCEEALYD